MAWMKRVALCALLFFVAVFAEVREASKPSKSATETPTPRSPPEPPKTTLTDQICDMEVIDYIRSGALLVGFLACMFSGKEVWLVADTIFLSVGGLSLFLFPESMVDYQTDGKLDSWHIYLAQVSGAMMFGMAMMSNSCRQSRDPAVHTNQFVARSLGGLVLIQCRILDFFKGYGDAQRLSVQSLTLGLLGQVLLTAGNIYYAFKSGSFGGGNSNLRNRVAVHTIIDLLLVTFFGLTNYSYPEVMLSVVGDGLKPDAIHAHMVRMVGCLLLMMIFEGVNALTFQADGEKQKYLLARLVMYVLHVPTFELYQWKYQFASPSIHMWGLLFHAVLITNLILGICQPLSFLKQKRR